MRSRVRPRGKWLRSTLMTKPLQIHSFSQQILPGMEGAQRLLRPLKDNRSTSLSSLLTLQPHVVFPKVHIQLSCKIKLPTTPCPPPNFITSWVDLWFCVGPHSCLSLATRWSCLPWLSLINYPLCPPGHHTFVLVSSGTNTNGKNSLLFLSPHPG